MPSVSGVVGPVIVRWYIMRMYSAASTMPNIASAAATWYRENVPTRTRNSLTNVASPGIARPLRPASSRNPDKIGAGFCRPPKSAS